MTTNIGFKQIFWQAWREIVFVHWQVDPLLLSSVLPPALEPDLFEGKAYIGLVPFRMTDIRSVWLPAIPGTSSTLETNVRTYVKRRCVAHEPIPAVWFFSLEAQNALAVTLARLQYGLPYFKASMKLSKESLSGVTTITAASSRSWPRPIPATSLVVAEFSSATEKSSATPGTLEHFLFERYALYALKRDRLTYARVVHSPYVFAKGTLTQVDTGLLTAAGLLPLHGAQNALVHQADDVKVRIGAPYYVS
jgi:uncharacterized protein YqjF (DUF2071 family)